MSHHPSAISWEQLQGLFSVVFCIDHNFQIVDASKTLKSYVDGLDLQPLLTEAFDISRPSSVTNYETARDHIGSIFLMQAKDRRFAIRGQIVETTVDGKPALYFCGAPWLFWINSNCPDVRLSLSDFSPQDVQLDQLFFMSTEKRMVQDLEQLNSELTQTRKDLERNQAAKNAFFTQMSHEMRTPLNGVVSALTLLRDQRLNGEMSKLVTLARSSAKNLMQVTNYVLDLSKIDAGGVAAHQEGFSLNELIDSVRNIVAAKANEKQIVLTHVSQPGMPTHYLGDLPRLRQSLLNLLINAIKFTNEGSIHLAVSRVSDRESSQDIVRFAVIDTGIGIPKSLQERIFEPFWSGSYADEEGEGGTGLGLDIVRKNVELMNGHVTLVSVVDEGSTFIIDVPLQSHVPEPIDDLEHNASLSENKNLKVHILLVDDNNTNLMLGAMILESLGITVSKANGGLAAVELAQDLNPDLILMDISMPDIDGFEATRRIRKFATAQNLPVVALTAFESNNERVRSREVGMNDYLTKPIDRQKLAEKLVTWLPETHAIGNIRDRNQKRDDDLVDKSVLVELQRQIGDKNLAIVIDKFLSEAAQRWDHFNNAVSTQKTKDCARHAHTLASTCKSFGLIEAGVQLAAIEKLVLNEGLPPAETIEEARSILLDSVACLRRSVGSLS